MRNFRSIFYLSCLLTLSSCAFKSMIYEHLDKVALYQIDSYLDLRSDQEQQIEEPIRDAVAWIKKEKLKEVIALIDRLAEAATKRSIDEPLIDETFEKFNQWRRELTAKLAKPASRLLQSLDDKQIAYLEKKLNKGNRKLQDLLAEDPADFPEELDDYTDDQLKRLKSWYKRLSPEQKIIYTQAINPSRSTLSQQLDARKATQSAWINLIKGKNEEKTLHFIEQWGNTGEVPGLDEKHQQYRIESRKHWREFWKSLHKNLSDEQWKHLQKRLEETSQDLGGILRKQAS